MPESKSPFEPAAERLMTGKELRDLIRQLPRSGRVYAKLNYNGYWWLQQWPRAKARSLGVRLSEVEAHRGANEETMAYVEVQSYAIIIAFQLQ